jgi:hypothetical protein
MLIFQVVMPRPYFVRMQKTNIGSVTLSASFIFALVEGDQEEGGSIKHFVHAVLSML